MFCSGVSDDLPVVSTSKERPIGSDGSEVIVGLVEEGMPAIIGEADFFT